MKYVKQQINKRCIANISKHHNVINRIWGLIQLSEIIIVYFLCLLIITKYAHQSPDLPHVTFIHAAGRTITIIQVYDRQAK